MATKGFTKINNSIIFDADLSLEALGLYVKLQYFSTIDNFSIKRDYVKSISGYGETAFRRVWKELKDKGVLIESKTSNKGRYEYTYTLKPNQDDKKVVDTVDKKKIKPKHVDSNGEAPLDGQIHIDDVLGENQQQEVPVKEDIEAVAEVTGLKDTEVTELLKAANNNVTKVIECHKYARAQSSVKNIFGYTKWAIKNNKILSVAHGSAEQKGYFNNYPQRNYDFDELERQLVFGIESKSIYL